MGPEYLVVRPTAKPRPCGSDLTPSSSSGAASIEVIWEGAEPYLTALLAEGRLVELPVLCQPMQERRCHTNAATLWAADMSGTKLMTGYGLAHDEWTPHSWVIRGGQLIETTARFERFFGITLIAAVALHFWSANYLPQFTDPNAEFERVAQTNPDIARLVLDAADAPDATLRDLRRWRSGRMPRRARRSGNG